jgi:hypothetical protein
MSVPPHELLSDSSASDLLEILGLPLDFGAAVLAADIIAPCEPSSSFAPILGTAVGSRSFDNPALAPSCCRTLDAELFPCAYACTHQGLRPPAVQVRFCDDGKGWGLFALDHFASGDVIFVETPMHCVVTPETETLHCNNCLRSFHPPLPHLPHCRLWTTDVHINCSRGGDYCSAIYCNAFCR